MNMYMSVKKKRIIRTITSATARKSGKKYPIPTCEYPSDPAMVRRLKKAFDEVLGRPHVKRNLEIIDAAIQRWISASNKAR